MVNLSQPKMNRCAWPKTELDIAYHDSEWGVPVHDDRLLVEMLILEGAQAVLTRAIFERNRNSSSISIIPTRGVSSTNSGLWQ